MQIEKDRTKDIMDDAAVYDLRPSDSTVNLMIDPTCCAPLTS
jgi:hypothetical protein